MGESDRISLTLDNEEENLVSDVKLLIAQEIGVRPQVLEALRYQENKLRTGQEAVMVGDDVAIDSPCRMLFSVNKNVVVEGQAEGQARCGLMGVYEHLAGKEVNGRGVWQQQADRNHFLFHAKNAKWYIGGKQNMEAGRNRGLMKVDSDADAPDQIVETWQVYNGTGAWSPAPNASARVCSLTEKQAGARQVKEEEERALSEAKGAPSVVMEGLPEDHVQQGCMGRYALVAGAVINKRGVWWMRELQEGAVRQERFLFYGFNQKNGSKKWYISTREHMEAGRATGFMKVDSMALTPDQIRASWLANDGGDAWPIAPHVQAVRASGSGSGGIEANADGQAVSAASGARA
jgi:hypothetical protein